MDIKTNLTSPEKDHGMKEEVDDLKKKLNKTLNLIENDINMRSISTMYN